MRNVPKNDFKQHCGNQFYLFTVIYKKTTEKYSNQTNRVFYREVPRISWLRIGINVDLSYIIKEIEI